MVPVSSTSKVEDGAVSKLNERMTSLEQIQETFRQTGCRYAEYYLTYAQASNGRFLALTEERENILGALHYADERPGLWRLFVETSASIHDYMATQGYWEGWEEILSTAVSISRKVNLREHEADLLTKLGGLLIDRGFYEKAENCLSQALELFSKVPSISRTVRAYAKRHLATLRLRTGRPEQALRLLQEALDSLTDGEMILKGNLLLHQANVHYSMGNSQLALSTLQEAERIFSANNEQRYLAGVFNLYGLIYRSTSTYNKAVDYFVRALAMFQAVGNKSACATVHSNLGFTLWTMGEFQDAARHLGLSLKIAREIGYQRMVASSYGNLGLVYMDLGDFGESLNCFNAQIRICQEVGDTREYGRAVGNLGILYYHTGDFQQALRCLDVDRDILLSSGVEASETLVYNSAYRGLAYYGLGDIDKASSQIQEALEMSRGVGSRTVEILALRGMARIVPDESKAYLEEALRLATSLKKTLDIGVCRFEIGLLADHIDREEREKLLNEALTIFENLSARSWLEKAVIALRDLQSDQ